MLEDRFFLADMSHLVYAAWNSLIEYETPRLVKIHNRKVGIVREGRFEKQEERERGRLRKTLHFLPVNER